MVHLSYTARSLIDVVELLGFQGNCILGVSMLFVACLELNYLKCGFRRYSIQH